jgi:hypothetical protein
VLLGLLQAQMLQSWLGAGLCCLVISCVALGLWIRRCQWAVHEREQERRLAVHLDELAQWKRACDSAADAYLQAEQLQRQSENERELRDQKAQKLIAEATRDRERRKRLEQQEAQAELERLAVERAQAEKKVRAEHAEAQARAHQLELDRKRLATARECLAWWTSEGQHFADAAYLAEHVRLHRRWILKQADGACAAYHTESSLTASYQQCLDLAVWMLEPARAGEVAYHFGANGHRVVSDNGLPTPEELARIFRSHHGRMREVLIPMARNFREDDRDPSIYSRLDPDATKLLEDAGSVVEMQRVAKELKRQHREEGRKNDVREEDLEEWSESYEKQIDRAVFKYARERGFVTS